MALHHAGFRRANSAQVNPPVASSNDNAVLGASRPGIALSAWIACCRHNSSPTTSTRSRYSASNGDTASGMHSTPRHHAASVRPLPSSHRAWPSNTKASAVLNAIGTRNVPPCTSAVACTIQPSKPIQPMPDNAAGAMAAGRAGSSSNEANSHPVQLSASICSALSNRPAAVCGSLHARSR